jgi:hypothetical protein
MLDMILGSLPWLPCADKSGRRTGSCSKHGFEDGGPDNVIKESQFAGDRPERCCFTKVAQTILYVHTLDTSYQTEFILKMVERDTSPSRKSEKST